MTLAFGQELKEFVAGFTTGYNLIESKEEKEWKREERRMRKEQHDRTGKWGDEDRAYRKDRAGRSDMESDRNYDFSNRKFDWGVETDNRNFKRARERDARSDTEYDNGVRERELERKRRDYQDKLRLREGTGGPIPDEVEKFVPIVPGESKPAEAIPSPSSYLDGDPTVDSQTTGAIQPASYSSDGDGMAGYEPANGQEIAWNLVQDLQDDFGMPEHVAIGVVGQLAGETGGFTQLQELNPLVKGSRGGSGYAQWTGPRRREFEGYIGDKDPSSYAANYAFLRHELANTPEGQVLKSLRGARTSQEAGRIFTDGFLRPGIKNYAGRDNWTRRVESLFRGKAINAAVGGLVSAIPDEEEEAPVTTEGNPRAIPAPDYSGEVAIGEPEDEKPTQVAEDTSASDEPTDDPYETARRAAREGLNLAIKQGQLDAQTALDDPELKKYEDRYLRGYGAAPQQVMRQIMDTIDPEKKMAPSQRNMLALANTYKFFWDRGEPEKAKEAALSLTQYYNKATQQFIALGQAAAERGDVDNAAKAAMAAYDNIPNGRDLKIVKNEDGSLTATVTDGKTGKEVSNNILKPEEMLATAMGFSPKTFYDELMNAAGAPAAEYDDASLEDMGKVSDAIRSTIETDFAESGLTKEGLAGIEDVATGIAKVKQNGVSPSQAVRLAAGMLSAPSMDDIAVKKERGHPDKVKVGFGGQEFIMSTGQFNLIKEAHKERSAKSSEQKKKDEESSKWWSDQIDLLNKGVRAFTESFTDDTHGPTPFTGAPSATVKGVKTLGGALGFGTSEAEAAEAIPDNSEEERERSMDDYLNVR